MNTYIHIAEADKRPDIAAIGKGIRCEHKDCPGPDGWEAGFGLAGGGYGVYNYCNTCNEVKEKDTESEEPQ